MPYIFYQIMWYPEVTTTQLARRGYTWSRDSHTLPDFVRDTPDPLLSQYCDFVHTYAWIWRSIPYIEDVYITNSITFNHLHNSSDIDVLIVVTPGKMRYARLFSWMICTVLRIKNFWRKGKSFCLSFYIDSDTQNLYPVSLKPLDPYLVYRIAHAVPIYRRNTLAPSLHTSNNRVRTYIPGYTWQMIDLGIDVSRWQNAFKTRCERRNIVNMCINQIIKIIRLPIVLYKKKRLWAKAWWMIIDDTMLKFHIDQRKSYAIKFKKAIQELCDTLPPE